MVLEANIKQSNAEKKYNETNNKVSKVRFKTYCDYAVNVKQVNLQ